MLFVIPFFLNSPFRGYHGSTLQILSACFFSSSITDFFYSICPLMLVFPRISLSAYFSRCTLYLDDGIRLHSFLYHHLFVYGNCLPSFTQPFLLLDSLSLLIITPLSKLEILKLLWLMLLLSSGLTLDTNQSARFPTTWVFPPVLPCYLLVQSPILSWLKHGQSLLLISLTAATQPPQWSFQSMNLAPLLGSTITSHSIIILKFG